MKQTPDSLLFLKTAVYDSPDITLDFVRGTYDCPKRRDGTRIGPLVGYTGKYDAGDGIMKQYVGDFYADFAYAEQYPQIYQIWATRMHKHLSPYGIDALPAPPLPGLPAPPPLPSHPASPPPH